jgi:hypothetical protein
LSNGIELVVELTPGDLEPSHRAHGTAVQEFMDYAHETPGVVVVDTPATTGEASKGSWEPIVLAIASPTSVAIVRMFRLWLQRDRARSVKVKICSGEQPSVEVEAKGENVSLRALQDTVEAALKASSDMKELYFDSCSY